MSGFSLLFMLLLVNPLTSLLSHPPRDLASLLDPAAVLQGMNVETSDDALIAMLMTPPDPTMEASYVQKLMAIRLLEQNKSAKALPALTAVVKGMDITLGDAALEAISAINGKPNPRPSGAALLKELAGSVPSDAGFVAALDFERGSRGITVRAFLENAVKELEAKAAAGVPANNNGQPSPAAVIGPMLTAMIPTAEQGIAQTLAETGNLRVDAALLVLPPKLGTQANEDYIRGVVKGLYDPARLAGMLENSGRFEKRETAGRPIYANKNGKMELCLLDANTLVFVLMNGSDKAGVMESWLGALAAAGHAPLQPALAEAFNLVTEHDARLAVAGTFSPEQKQSFITSLMSNLKPNNLQLDANAQVAFSGSQMLLNIVQAQAYAASLDTQGKVALHIVCANAEAATALNDSADKLQTTLFDMITKKSASAPPTFAMLLDQVTKAGCLWKSEVADNKVTIHLDNVLLPIMSFGMIHTQARRDQEREMQLQRAQPAAPVQPIQPK